MRNHPKQILRPRIPARPKHPLQTRRRDLRHLRQLREADRRIDVIPQNRSASRKIAVIDKLQPLTEQALSKRRLTLGALADRLAEIFSQSHRILLSLALLVILPDRLRASDVPLLALLRATANQNDESFAVLAEVDAIARPEIDLVFGHAFADRLDRRRMPLRDPLQCDRHFDGGLPFKRSKPHTERASPFVVNILPNNDHRVYNITYVINSLSSRTPTLKNP